MAQSQKFLSTDCDSQELKQNFLLSK